LISEIRLNNSLATDASLCLGRHIPIPKFAMLESSSIGSSRLVSCRLEVLGSARMHAFFPASYERGHHRVRKELSSATVIEAVPLLQCIARYGTGTISSSPISAILN